MSSNNYTNSCKKEIFVKFRVSEDQRKYIENYCRREKISKQYFLSARIFDIPSRAHEHHDIIVRRSPAFFMAVNRIGDADIRQELLDFWDNLLRAMED